MPQIRTLLFIFALLVAACGGRQDSPEGGESLLVGDGSLMGELEEQAKNYLLDLTFLVETGGDDPDATLDRVEAMLAVNGDAMLENAADLQARFDAFDGVERRLYEAQFAAFMDEALQSWQVALQQFRNQHDEAGRTIWWLVEDLDGR